MKLRGIPFFVLIFTHLAARVEGQAAGAVRAGPEAAASIPFSLVSLLETLAADAVVWRPDWPFDIPPDAFLVHGASAASVGVITETGTYRYSRDGEGRLVEFPFLTAGVMVQAKAAYRSDGGMESVRVASEIPWIIEFPENLSSPNGLFTGGVFSPLRVSGEGALFFAALEATASEISETWYDAGEKAAGFFKALVLWSGNSWHITSLESRNGGEPNVWEYQMESGGNVSAVNSLEGLFSAQYDRRGLPRYWERILLETELDAGTASTTEASEADASETVASETAMGRSSGAGQYSLQWDERSLLTRARESTEGADYHYEYELDGRGNWIVRRETTMESRFGVLIPVPRSLVRREIIYAPED
jgi:hypothetical protein